jgi:hypothetical protein
MRDRAEAAAAWSSVIDVAGDGCWSARVWQRLPVHDLDEVVAIRPPDPDHPGLLRLVASGHPETLTMELARKSQARGFQLRFLVYGPEPAPWARLHVVDRAGNDYTIVITFE